MSREKIIITATSNIIFDQRVQRVDRALNEAGYDVLIIGRIKRSESTLRDKASDRTRLITCFFEKSWLFYAEYNLRLFLILLSQRWDIVYACDADTLLAGTMAKLIKRKKIIYDSHEYFEESPEIGDKKWIQFAWTTIQRFCIPHTQLRFSVSKTLCTELSRKYKSEFYLLRNVPLKRKFSRTSIYNAKIIIYQGVINQGRGLEQMIQAIRSLDEYHLWIVGEGDIKEQLESMVLHEGLSDQVLFFERRTPEVLYEMTLKASIGINLLSGDSKNYYYSGANKCYDYIQAGLPSIQMNFPEYVALNSEFEVSVLIDDLEVKTIVAAVRKLEDLDYYRLLQSNCITASEIYHWEHEKNNLLDRINYI
jgi:glycosyltransferase involved in cell wall biosynthesis